MNNSPPRADLDAGLLAELLDEIIPPSPDGQVPAAGALGVDRYVISECASDPTLSTRVREVLSRAAAYADTQGKEFSDLDAARRIAIVKALEQDAAEAFPTLLRVAYMGYYSRPDVRRCFGLSAGPTQPDGYEVPDDDPGEMAELLAPVRGRGRCYRLS